MSCLLNFFVCVIVCMFVCVSTCLVVSTRLSVCVYLFFYGLVCLSAILSIFLSVHICPRVCLPCLFLYPRVCLSSYLPFFSLSFFCPSLCHGSSLPVSVPARVCLSVPIYLSCAPTIPRHGYPLMSKSCCSSRGMHTHRSRRVCVYVYGDACAWLYAFWHTGEESSRENLQSGVSVLSYPPGILKVCYYYHAGCEGESERV